MRPPPPATSRPWAIGLALALGASAGTAARGSGAARPAAPADVALRFCRARCGPTFRLQVADTPRAHARGLMGVTSLPPRGGMLFVFDGPARRVFWMKDTPLALDIVFVGADCRVLDVVRNAVPFDEGSLPGRGDAQYVVEVGAGGAAGVRTGDRITFRTEAGPSGPLPDEAVGEAKAAAVVRRAAPR